MPINSPSARLDRRPLPVRNRLGWSSGLVGAILVGFAFFLVACQRTELNRNGSSRAQPKAAAPSRARTAPAPSTQRPTSSGATNTAAADPSGPAEGPNTLQELLGSNVPVSPTYSEELGQIMNLARRNEWQEAEARAAALYALDPKDAAVARVYNWVKTEGPKRREKALENKIREVSAKDSRFEPTLKSILMDKESRRLPPRSDLRDTIDKIKAAPYIPENFGKTIQKKGTLEDFDSQRGKMAAILEKQIDVHLDNITLENIVFRVGQAEGINFIADRSLPAFQQKLSVNMQKVKLAEFLHYVARNLGLQFQIGDDLIWITDAKDPKNLLETTRFYKLREGLILPAQFGISDTVKTTVTVNNVPTVTEVQRFDNFVRDGAPKTPMVDVAIKKFFEGSKYQLDLEHNLILARGTEEQLQVLESILREFDKPIQQVLIEARFITVTEPKFLQLGVIWESGRNPLTLGRSATDNTGLSAGGVGRGIQESWYGVLGQETLSATLSAIDQSGESEVLSAPRVTLINNLPATISDGKIQYYYEEYQIETTYTERRSTSDIVPSGKPTKLNSGVSLDVVASIGGDGQSILLALRPKVTEDVIFVTFATISDRDAAGNVTSSFDIRLPQYREQSLSTRAVVRSGQTIVMGGVVQRDQKTFIESVPVLSQIPLLGAAFRRRTEIDIPRYLLIFVTATLLSDSGEFIVSSDAK